MTIKLLTLAYLIAILVALCGCSTEDKLKPPTQGITQIYSASNSELKKAITNAFNLMGYEDMVFTGALGEGDMVKKLDQTNGYILTPGTGTSYRATYYILPEVVSSNQTFVTVKTLSVKKLAGREPGIHGGWAFRFKKVPATPGEEEKVLDAITKSLEAEKEKVVK